ncbi:hypothetical protein QUF75_00050 [Desulfococcaceae bacterium HSG7]|nr:hypothetical protein [Desulfococcaceae bacterium HSG7]
MKLIADTHIHLYPCYNLITAFDNLRLNLQKLAPAASRAAFFSERSDCNYFADIRDGSVKVISDDFRIEPLNEKDGLVLIEKNDSVLYLFSGRQIVTEERIEILALTTDAMIPDFMPAKNVINAVSDTGGVPVLSWAPGKWLFKRKNIVRELIDYFSPNQMLISDTTLRPTLWMEPSLMRRAVEKGFSVLAGSDPLPFIGEEKYLGIYGSILNGPFDINKPVSSIRKLLVSPDVIKTRAGKRCSLPAIIRRLIKNARTKHLSA